MLDLLKQSLMNAPVIKKGEYNYFVHPITDGIPSIDPGMLQEIAYYIRSVTRVRNVSKIVTIEAMGMPIGTALSMITGIPLSVVRKRKYGLPGELELNQKTGYSSGKLYMNGITEDDTVLIVDDVISTGGTIRSVIDGIDTIGAKIRDVVIVVEKGEGANKLNDLGFGIKTLVKVEVDSEKVCSVEEVKYAKRNL